MTNFEKYAGMTIVDTFGKVLQQGDKGLLIVSESEHAETTPLMTINEISDARAMSVFVRAENGNWREESNFTQELCVSRH